MYVFQRYFISLQLCFQESIDKVRRPVVFGSNTYARRIFELLRIINSRTNSVDTNSKNWIVGGDAQVRLLVGRWS